MSAKAERLRGHGLDRVDVCVEADAVDVLADRRRFVLDPKAWLVFDEALTRSASEVSGLRELLAGPTVLDAPQTGEGQ